MIQYHDVNLLFHVANLKKKLFDFKNINFILNFFKSNKIL